MKNAYARIADILARSLDAGSLTLHGEGMAARQIAELPIAHFGADAAQAAARLAVSVNELEKAQPADLDALIQSRKDGGTHHIFVVSTIFSLKLDDDGVNVNRIIERPEWWRDRLAAYFPGITRLPEVEPHEVIFLSWAPQSAARKRLTKALKWMKLVSRIRALPGRLVQRLRVKRARFMSERLLSHLLDGKSVALVGNAVSLRDRAFGAAIDANDIVIRCNRAPIITTRSHGTRTDWIATSIDIPEDVPRERGARLILWMSPKLKRLPSWLFHWPQVFMNSRAGNQRLAEHLGSRPSTGAMVIDLLVRSNCRSVELYGFDFFSGLSLSGVHTRETTPHDFGSEEVWVQQLLEMDSRFSLHR
ncbi:MAG TPA: hypothetical protein DIC56_23100 [Rhizobium sp.]|nr:hypothetical protein [Rhizobium sp.]